MSDETLSPKTLLDYYEKKIEQIASQNRHVYDPSQLEFDDDETYAKYRRLIKLREKELQKLESPSKRNAMTPREAAKFLGVSKNKVLGWIGNGQLKATNVADPGKKPRWAILPHQLDEFVKLRESSSTPKPTRRKRQPPKIDFYPELPG